MAALMFAALSESGSENKKPTGKPPKNTPRRPAPPPKGLKMFDIDGVQVWAINEKNARRKAEKLTNKNQYQYGNENIADRQADAE